MDERAPREMRRLLRVDQYPVFPVVGVAREKSAISLEPSLCVVRELEVVGRACDEKVVGTNSLEPRQCRDEQVIHWLLQLRDPVHHVDARSDLEEVRSLVGRAADLGVDRKPGAMRGV